MFRRACGLLFAVLVAIATPAAADNAGPIRWPAGTVVVVSDRTGDPAWQAATRYAVAAWNSSGAGIRLAWSEGGIGCQPEGPVVPVCRHAIGAFAGLATWYTQGARIVGGFVLVTDGRPTQIQRNAIATHEIGHTLGIGHSTDRTSIMAPSGNGTDHLRPHDHHSLIQMYRRTRP